MNALELLSPNDPDHLDRPACEVDSDEAGAQARRDGLAAFQRLGPDEQRQRIAEEVAF